MTKSSQSQCQSKVKESKERPKTLMPYVIYYVLVYECLCVIVMITYDHSCCYCIIIACHVRLKETHFG